MVRTNFAANFDSTCLRFTDQAHASSGANVLAVNVMIAKFRQQDIPHHDRFFASSRPSGQTEQRAPIAFVHHAVPDQIVILAMIEHGQSDHACVLHCAPHQFMILDAMTVVGDRDHAGLA